MEVKSNLKETLHAKIVEAISNSKTSIAPTNDLVVAVNLKTEEIEIFMIQDSLEAVKQPAWKIKNVLAGKATYAGEWTFFSLYKYSFVSLCEKIQQAQKAMLRKTGTPIMATVVENGKQEFYPNVCQATVALNCENSGAHHHISKAAKSGNISHGRKWEFVDG